MFEVKTWRKLKTLYAAWSAGSNSARGIIQRKRQEMHLNFRLGKCQLRGLNVDFQFIWSLRVRAQHNFQILNQLLVIVALNINEHSKGTVPKRLDICYDFGTFTPVSAFISLMFEVIILVRTIFSHLGSPDDLKYGSLHLKYWSLNLKHCEL